MAMIGLAVASPVLAASGRVTMRTPSLVPDADGYLYCTVVATGDKLVDIVARIVSEDGSDVTEFGTSFRASPAVTGDGTYRAEQTAGSLADGARFCRVHVTGADRDDVDITLTAFDASGRAVATVTER